MAPLVLVETFGVVFGGDLDVDFGSVVVVVVVVVVVLPPEGWADTCAAKAIIRKTAVANSRKQESVFSIYAMAPNCITDF